MSTSFAMGRVALTVNNLASVGQWYETAVGLHLLSKDGETAQYGVGREVLLELRQDKHARKRSHKEAGLFHSAFLLPERADLARWVLDASEKRTPVDGASDHAVSEALYLTDPEGNGVEIYTDRPAQAWKTNGKMVHMVSDPLDIADLVSAAHGSKRWAGVPEGTIMGHVHLQTGTIPEAEAFYSNVMGLDVTARYPGGSFYAADGYHHHIATNIWNSRGAAKRDMPSTGLTEMEIRLSGDRAAAIAKQTETTSGAAQEILLQDPWGTPIALKIV